jgi:hypothetical protein
MRVSEPDIQAALGRMTISVREEASVADVQHFWIDPVTRRAAGPDAFHVPWDQWEHLRLAPCPDCDTAAELEPLNMWNPTMGYSTYQPNGRWACPNGCHRTRGGSEPRRAG